MVLEVTRLRRKFLPLVDITQVGEDGEEFESLSLSPPSPIWLAKYRCVSRVCARVSPSEKAAARSAREPEQQR